MEKMFWISWSDVELIRFVRCFQFLAGAASMVVPGTVDVYEGDHNDFGFIRKIPRTHDCKQIKFLF